MTVYFPDSPGDCPTGMYLSVISCAEAARGPPHRSALIPTTPTTNFPTVIRLPSFPSFDEERPRLLLLANGLLSVLPAEEYTPDGLLGQPSGFLEVGDGLGVKATALQHPSTVLRLAPGSLEEPPFLFGRRRRETRLQQHDALADILEHVDDPQEGGHRHDLRPIEFDAHAPGIGGGQRAAGRGFVERLAVVERDRSFDGLDGIVVEEGPGVCGLHQRRHIEGAVARRAEPVITGDHLAGQASGLVGKILHAGVEV